MKNTILALTITTLLSTSVNAYDTAKAVEIQLCPNYQSQIADMTDNAIDGKLQLSGWKSLLKGSKRFVEICGQNKNISKSDLKDIANNIPFIQKEYDKLHKISEAEIDASAKKYAKQREAELEAKKAKKAKKAKNSKACKEAQKSFNFVEQVFKSSMNMDCGLELFECEMSRERWSKSMLKAVDEVRANCNLTRRQLNKLNSMEATAEQFAPAF